MPSPNEQVDLRIGINTGEAIPEDDDLFGSAVVAAQRITSKAQGGQILVSEVVRGVVGAATDIEFVERGRFQLKGFPRRWRLYEVPWQAEASAPEAVMLTFLFTDVAGSTEIAERLGDELWLDVVRAHNAIIRAELAAHESSWSKSLGDGFLAAFPTATDAVKCAISLQHDFVEYNDEHTEEPLRVRVGLHTGQAVKEADDYYGRAVHLAARIAGQAKARGILVSERLKEITEDTHEFAFDDGREVHLRGVLGPVRVYEVLWEEAK
jgi:class 3 adenylate cyclase